MKKHTTYDLHVSPIQPSPDLLISLFSFDLLVFVGMTLLAQAMAKLAPPHGLIHMATCRPPHNTPIHMDFLYGSLLKGTKSMWIGVLWACLPRESFKVVFCLRLTQLIFALHGYFCLARPKVKNNPKKFLGCGSPCGSPMWGANFAMAGDRKVTDFSSQGFFASSSSQNLAVIGNGNCQSNLSGDTFSIEAPQNLLRTKRMC